MFAAAELKTIALIADVEPLRIHTNRHISQAAGQTAETLGMALLAIGEERLAAEERRRPDRSAVFARLGDAETKRGLLVALLRGGDGADEDVAEGPAFGPGGRGLARPRGGDAGRDPAGRGVGVAGYQTDGDADDKPRRVSMAPSARSFGRRARRRWPSLPANRFPPAKTIRHAWRGICATSWREGRPTAATRSPTGSKAGWRRRIETGHEASRQGHEIASAQCSLSRGRTIALTRPITISASPRSQP